MGHELRELKLDVRVAYVCCRLITLFLTSQYKAFDVVLGHPALKIDQLVLGT